MAALEASASSEEGRYLVMYIYQMRLHLWMICTKEPQALLSQPPQTIRYFISGILKIHFSDIFSRAQYLL